MIPQLIETPSCERNSTPLLNCYQDLRIRESKYYLGRVRNTEMYFRIDGITAFPRCVRG
ncbi:Uncharacterised protein [Mycobacteroides abscessus subsp. abscessus]|nr:Uncharacterised protein [Mycobacteroides abscessus subsp. abscessus]